MAAKNGSKRLPGMNPRSRPPTNAPASDPAAINAKKARFLPSAEKFWLLL